MVWGLVAPDGFNEFSPNGNYVGYDEALRAYFDNEMSEAEKESSGMKQQGFMVTYSTAKFIANKGRLRPHECPQVYKSFQTPKALGSLIELNSFLFAVDQPLMDIIERLEPGVHQFWPMRIETPKGEFPRQFFGMVVHRHLDSFRPEKSDPGAWKQSGTSYDVYSYAPMKKYCSGLAMSSEVIGSAHLWREKWLRRPHFFLSDQLQRAIEDAGLRIPKHYRLKTAEEAPTEAPTKTLAPHGSTEWIHFQASLPKSKARKAKAETDVAWGFFQHYGHLGFTPGGHYPGFGQALETYYNEEMSEFEKARLEMRDGLRYAPFGRKFAEDLGPLRPRECPVEFQTVSAYQTLPSFMALNASLPQSKEHDFSNNYGRVLAVDDRLKAIIEALEPGVHQFWPIRFIMAPGRTEAPTPVHAMVIRRFIDSFDPDASTPGSFRQRSGNYYCEKEAPKPVSGLRLSKALIGAAHLWREKRLKHPAVYLSAELMAAINDAGLVVPKFHKLRLV